MAPQENTSTHGEAASEPTLKLSDDEALGKYWNVIEAEKSPEQKKPRVSEDAVFQSSSASPDEPTTGEALALSSPLPGITTPQNIDTNDPHDASEEGGIVAREHAVVNHVLCEAASTR